MIILETERLLLRYLVPQDIPLLINLWTDPDVTRFMGGPRDVETLQKNLKKKAQNPSAEQFDLWPLIERSSGNLIGNCGLLAKEVGGVTEYEVIYVLAKSAWGNGYASEIGRALGTYAYHVRGINRLVALVQPENTASERVAQKMGMRLEKEIVRPEGGIRRLYAMYLPH